MMWKATTRNSLDSNYFISKTDEFPTAIDWVCSVIAAVFLSPSSYSFVYAHTSYLITSGDGDLHARMSADIFYFLFFVGAVRKECYFFPLLFRLIIDDWETIQVRWNISVRLSDFFFCFFSSSPSFANNCDNRIQSQSTPETASCTVQSGVRCLGQSCTSCQTSSTYLKLLCARSFPPCLVCCPCNPKPSRFIQTERSGPRESEKRKLRKWG